MPSPDMRSGAAAALIGLLGLTVWVVSHPFPALEGGHPGPALFPRVVAAGLMLSALGLLRPSPGPPKSAGSWSRHRMLRLIAAILTIAVFPLLPPVLGIGSTCLVVALLLDIHPKVAVGLALLSCLFLYGLFALALGVPLT